MNKKKKGYSAEEKKAYYMGLGAGRTGGKPVGIKKVMDELSPMVRQSFKNGLDDGMLYHLKSKKTNKR